MNRVKTCTNCGETKNVSEFIVEDKKRKGICTDCAVADAVDFIDAIEDMGDDFTPVDELTFPDEQ